MLLFSFVIYTYSDKRTERPKNITNLGEAFKFLNVRCLNEVET